MKRIAGLILFVFIGAITVNCCAQGNVWVQKADISQGRSYAVSFSIGNKGYVATGGELTASYYSKDLWEYDPVTNAWTQKADFGGTARIAAVGFSIGNKGYVGTGDTGTLGNSTRDFWEYDPATNAWTQKANFGGSARYGATGFSIGNKGYLGTGVDGGSAKKDFWEYNPATNTWAQKADLGGLARFGASGFSINDKGYISAGIGDITYQNDFWCYDPATNSWTEKNAPFAANSGAVGFSIGNKGYLGTGNLGGQPSLIFSEYDPITNFWSYISYFTGMERQAAIGFSIGGKGYLACGENSSTSYLNDLWEYTPACQSAVSIAQSPAVICPGSAVTFTATPVNGGLTPMYTWLRNNVATGPASPAAAYTTSSLANGDTITCILSSSASCITETSSDRLKVGFGNPAAYLPAVSNTIQSNNQNIHVVSTASGNSITNIPFADSARGSCVSRDGKRVYITRRSPNGTVSVINTATNTIIATIPVGSNPLGIDINPEGTRVYVANESGNSISVINAVNNTLITTVSLGSYSPRGLCVSPLSNKVYITTADRVLIFNTIDNTLSPTTISVPTLGVPICINADASRVFVTRQDNNSVGMILTNTNVLIVSMPVGEGATDLCMYGKLLYVTNRDDSSITEILTTSSAVNAVMHVRHRPYSVDIDPVTGRLFVTHENDPSVTVINTLTRTAIDTIPISNPVRLIGSFVAYNPGGCVIPCTTSYWTGAVSNAWENAANWSCGTIPDAATTVIINSGTVLLSSNTTIYSLQVNPNATVTIGAGFNLTVLH